MFETKLTHLIQTAMPCLKQTAGRTIDQNAAVRAHCQPASDFK